MQALFFDQNTTANATHYKISNLANAAYLKKVGPTRKSHRKNPAGKEQLMYRTAPQNKK
jgi:hypothetical protein